MRGRVSREAEANGLRSRGGRGGGGGWPAGSGRRDDRKGVSGSGGRGWVTFTLPVHGDI